MLYRKGREKVRSTRRIERFEQQRAHPMALRGEGHKIRIGQGFAQRVFSPGLTANKGFPAAPVNDEPTGAA
jgi:hypothetical protein